MGSRSQRTVAEFIRRPEYGNHLPPVTPAQAQSPIYRDDPKSQQRRDLCWEATQLVFTVQPMMANELQGEIHSLPTPERVREEVEEEIDAREPGR